VSGRARRFTSLQLTRRFEKSFRRLGSDAQAQCEDALEQLVQDSVLPGLHLKPIRPNNKFWEARLNSGDRIVLLPDGDTAWVMDVISHDEIKLWGKKR
jgi:mRNA-degrading endonuclease RelE of RelBE toxin-antitoxin system